MEPISFTVGLITAFKEVYLLSRCLYRACESARASDEEREKLRHDLRFELIYVQSFGRFYLKNSNVSNDARLDNHWSFVICEIFEDLRKSLNDYKKLDDYQYNQFSPYVNESMYNTNTIEFPLDEKISDAVLKGKKISLSIPFFSRVRESSLAAGKSAKWALFDKKKLEASILAIQQETRKLRGLLPLAQSAQFSKLENKVGALTATILDHDADRLGLVAHAKLIEFNEANQDTYTDANERKDCIVKAKSAESELHPGTVELKRLGSKTNDCESVLIELKHYPPGDDDLESDQPDPDTEANVRRLAGLLQISESGSRELRTLPFKFFVHQPEEERYAFIFGYPLHAEHSKPLSLYELIKNSRIEQGIPLAIRFRIAQMIAQSIGVFHADGWVHKSICSQSIVFFRNRNTKTLMLESPYLVDFGYSRPEYARTYARYHQSSDVTTLYLHPHRPKMAFTKLHDVYALGVVLLEIATWTVAEDRFAAAAREIDLSKTSISKEDVREMFKRVAKKTIPYHMGESYMEAVYACLDDTYRGQTGGPEFIEIFQSEVIKKLGADQLLK